MGTFCHTGLRLYPKQGGADDRDTGTRSKGGPQGKCTMRAESLLSSRIPVRKSALIEASERDGLSEDKVIARPVALGTGESLNRFAERDSVKLAWWRAISTLRFGFPSLEAFRQTDHGLRYLNRAIRTV